MEKIQINNNIDAQVSFNTSGLKWLKKFKGDDQRAYERLINNRRRLKRIKYAMNINPAAAIYGESQVGKSYLVDCLLSSEKGSLQVYDGNGVKYGFIDKLNPLGGGQESTSLVSRFTTQKYWTNDKYPIKALMLSPTDIVLLLCDSYYNDVVQNHSSSEKEKQIKQKIASIKNRYDNAPEVQQFIVEDDIYDMKEYFNSGYLDRGDFYLFTDTGYFKTLSETITKIPVNDWTNVFSILWGENKHITETFRILIAAFERMEFRHEVFISMDAVMRTTGTLLDVSRIYELFGLQKMEDGREIERAPVQEIMVLVGQSEVMIPKSAFCALAAELIFKVDSELANEKTFLNEIDLLDFPGARGRMKYGEMEVTKSTCCFMLLRGKVAYLFNKYSVNYLISNLLFCYHDKQTEISATLSLLLKKWVESSIGETPEKRMTFISDSKISPLFIVGTKFNIDLLKDSQDKGDAMEREQKLNHRWKKRFSNTLLSILGENNNNKWFSEWIKTDSGFEKFKNNYLLRSYDYSDRGGIFSGYLKFENDDKVLNFNDDGTLMGELDYTDEYRNFLPQLKESFVKYSFVSEHFINPSKSWDEAVTINKDGSAWIIENLTTAGTNTSQSCQKKFEREISSLFEELEHVLRGFFHDEDKDKEIKRNLNQAGMISLELDKLFGQDREFFSQFIQSLLVKESDVYDLILDTINGMEVVDNTTFNALFAIRNRAKINVNPELSEDENLSINTERLRVCYEFKTTTELTDYLKQIKLDIKDIINPPLTKNFAAIISEVIEKMWFEKYLSESRFKSYIERGFSSGRLTDLLQHMKDLYRKKLHITDLIILRIRKYLTNPNAADLMAEMLADICAEMINRFVNEMGYSYYDAETWKQVERTNEENQLGLCLDKSHLSVESSMDASSIAEVFEVLENLDSILNQADIPRDKIKNIPNYSNYVRWTDLMKISFVARCDIPTYDLTANNELRIILESFKSLEKI